MNDEKEFWEKKLMEFEKTIIYKIEALEKKVESLDLEKKLKIDYMLKMNQLEKNDKAHQALYDKLFKEISELKDKELTNWTDIRNFTNKLQDEIEKLKNK